MSQQSSGRSPAVRSEGAVPNMVTAIDVGVAVETEQATDHPRSMVVINHQEGHWATAEVAASADKFDQLGANAAQRSRSGGEYWPCISVTCRTAHSLRHRVSDDRTWPEVDRPCEVELVVKASGAGPAPESVRCIGPPTTVLNVADDGGFHCEAAVDDRTPAGLDEVEPAIGTCRLPA